MSSRLKMSHTFCLEAETVGRTLLLCLTTQRHILLNWRMYTIGWTCCLESMTIALIFVDEINRFIPWSAHNISSSAVAEQIMRTVVAGRSRGTILFSAQQFKSTVDPTFHENMGMHVIAKLGISELSTPHYSMIDESTKANIARLNKGELVMVHPAIRQPIKIVFPKAPFKTG